MTRRCQYSTNAERVSLITNVAETYPCHISGVANRCNSFVTMMVSVRRKRSFPLLPQGGIRKLNFSKRWNLAPGTERCVNETVTTSVSFFRTVGPGGCAATDQITMLNWNLTVLKPPDCALDGTSCITLLGKHLLDYWLSFTV